MKPRIVFLSIAAVLAASPARAQRELAYDDGTAEHSVVWNDPGNGLAVRFSAQPPGSILLGARFCTGFAPFWNPLGICVLNANGLGGSPGDTLCSYFVEDLDSWSGWQDVAFRSPIPLLSDEFYVVYCKLAPETLTRPHSCSTPRAPHPVAPGSMRTTAGRSCRPAT